MTLNPTQLHDDSIIIDGLNASWFLNDEVFKRLHRGGVTAVNATVAAWHNPSETMDMIEQVLQTIERYQDIAMQVQTAEDIRTAKTSGRVGFILGFQDTAPIADKLNLLETYYRLGVRIIQLTYNFENLVGCGCRAPEDKGLTSLGHEAIAEMNRLGILIDLSHCGERTTLEAVELSKKPVAITHANAASQFPDARNKSDEVIRTCADNGGVIGAISFPAMLTHTLPATINDYLSAVDYLVDIVGVEHVGLGPDFMEEMPVEVRNTVLQGLPSNVVDLLTTMPPVQDFASVSEMPNVTAGLLARGYSPKDTQKIMGENWMKLYEQVW